MVWKMSSDLTRVLVPSMGHHDPLDGLVTYTQLRTNAAARGLREGPDLTEALSDFERMCEGRDWLTIDPLGLGGLMTDAWRVEELMRVGAFPDGRLLDVLLTAALDGLVAYDQEQLTEVSRPAAMRLAFRELGLAIGLHAVELLEEQLRRNPGRFPGGVDARVRAERLARQQPRGAGIEAFWLIGEHRENRTWLSHRDINEVMLATTLMPQGFLLL